MTTLHFRKRADDQDGLTLQEIILAVALVSIAAVPASFLLLNQVRLRDTAESSVLHGQVMNLLLTRFTADVRAADALLTPITSLQELVLRQPQGGGAFIYVRYRLAGGRLQRGEAASANAEPATWENLIDPAQFTVRSGEFAYFTQSGAPATDARTTRLIELRALNLLASSGEALHPRPVSATMRAAQGTGIVVLADLPELLPDPAGGTRIRFRLVNIGEGPVAFKGFQATWNDKARPANDVSLDWAIFGASPSESQWKGDYASGEAMVALPTPFGMGAGGSAPVELHVQAKGGTFPMEGILFRLYPSDGSEPLLVPIQGMAPFPIAGGGPTPLPTPAPTPEPTPSPRPSVSPLPSSAPSPTPTPASKGNWAVWSGGSVVFQGSPRFPYAGIHAAGNLNLNGHAHIAADVEVGGIVWENSWRELAVLDGGGRVVKHAAVKPVPTYSQVALEALAAEAKASKIALMTQGFDKALQGYYCASGGYDIHHPPTSNAQMSLANYDGKGNRIVNGVCFVEGDLRIDNLELSGSGVIVATGRILIGGTVRIRPGEDPAGLALVSLSRADDAFELYCSGSSEFSNVFFAPYGGIQVSTGPTFNGSLISGKSMTFSGSSAFNWNGSDLSVLRL